VSLLTPAQAGAQFLSLIVFASIARWYVAPWLTGRPRADALMALLWIHVFRYLALQVVATDGTLVQNLRVIGIETMLVILSGAALYLELAGASPEAREELREGRAPLGRARFRFSKDIRGAWSGRRIAIRR